MKSKMKSIMKSAVKKFNLESEYYFKEGCFITEVSNSMNDEAVSIVRARLEPGKQTKWHALAETSERYVILDGTGLVEVGDSEAETVSKGDVVIIPPLCKQRILNTGEEDLNFHAVCTPRFKPENYRELEQT